MIQNCIVCTNKVWLICVWCLGLIWSSCNTTKHVPEDKFLLRSNSIKLASDRSITNKGELKDQLTSIVFQKPNTYWSGIIPIKLIKYNWRSDKYINNPNLQLPKSLERPVIFDTNYQNRSTDNLKSFLFNQGYFNATVTDTVKYKNRKAYAEYKVTTGLQYLVGDVTLDIEDSAITSIISDNMDKTLFTKEVTYTKSLADLERARIIALMQNNGYYKFSQDNIGFELDTLNKEKLRESENLFESAINFITLQKKQKKRSLDIKIWIRKGTDSASFSPYTIKNVTIFPDFIDRYSANDPKMIDKSNDSVTIRYHKYYIREQILQKQVFIKKGSLYSREDHELTINKLNELGVFQLVNVVFVEDTLNKDAHSLNCYVVLSPTKRSDAGASFEITNATTYFLGNSAGLIYRDKNFFKGANQLSISTTGGVELGYLMDKGDSFWEHLFLQSTNIGINGALLFPKFLSPFKPRFISPRNLPKTQLTLGVNVLDRKEQFKLANISSAFSYNWKRNITQTWELTPAFANVVLPTIRPAFQMRLDSNEFLKNSYRRTLIEGESIAYIFSDQQKKENKNYNYIRLSFEEAGLIVSGINSIHKAVSNSNGFKYDQYFKFDLDARRYFNAKHSLLALRFLAGVGNPYGNSRTLPYIKQYFVGGPYSIRGWRPRTLGPRSITDTTNSTLIDRTGDIRIEINAEYRFDMIKLFSGVLSLNGALFADAGNTWLAKKSDAYINGEFDISRLGQDLAVSTGAGLRVIVAGFFTVRLDAAFPIKNPYILSDNGWILNKVDLGNSSWRKNNLVINVAIGMPF
jgi:outer membrane protein insertion porin family